MTVEQQQKLLPVMTEAFVSLSKQDVFRTEDFIKTCDTVVPMFEHIGARRAGGAPRGRAAGGVLNVRDATRAPGRVWRA